MTSFKNNLINLGPIVLTFGAFLFFGWSIFYFALLFFGFGWVYLLLNLERAYFLTNQKSYRWSFVKVATSIHHFIEKSLPKKTPPFLLRIISPFLFWTILVYILGTDQNIFMSFCMIFCGGLLAEILAIKKS